MSDEWGLTKDLMLGDEHLGQKVYANRTRSFICC